MSLNLKVNDESLKALEENTRKAFEKVIRNQDLLNDIGKTIITDIQFQTRRGSSIPNNGKKFDKLSKKWIDMRARIGQAQGGGEAFSPQRSNLTLSGQLLNSLVTVIQGAGKILITFTGTHSPYRYELLEYYTVKKRKGRRINKGPIKGFDGGRGNLQYRNTNRSGQTTLGEEMLNAELADLVAEQGRPFLGIRDAIRDRIKRQVVAFIRRSSRVLSLVNKR
jgi:hypothetical protein